MTVAPRKITLFEEHDTLLPLQQGSDTRWLHPHIYDWPDEGSEASVANLPLLNWTAARASDVVVQILQDWSRIEREASGDKVELFCNTRHLQIARCGDDAARIEWVGERRDPADGTIRPRDDAARGNAGTFDLVVLAVGFGIEQGQPSYWRNETLGQPSLYQRRRTHLVSGQGDGAMIDLLRIRISQYRQDRILEEMFADKLILVEGLRQIKGKYGRAPKQTNLFDSFDALFGEQAATKGDASEVMERLARRLRRDTEAVLQLKVRDLAELLKPTTSRTSFQNALLVYLLYRVGGFAPSSEKERILRERYVIPHDQVVRRYGTKRMPQLRRILSAPLFEAIEERCNGNEDFAKQEATMLWPGGYFGYPGRTADVGALKDDNLRSFWRKEYLPGPTALIAATICGAVVGAIYDMRPNLSHVRATVHRVLLLHGEKLLQQACDYQGAGFDPPSRSTAGRTFPARSAMIGLAYRCQRPARTRSSATNQQLQEAMNKLNLHDAARNMMHQVSYILALPILQPSKWGYPPSRVAAVVYLDSQDGHFALQDHEIGRLSRVIESAFDGIMVQYGRMMQSDWPFLVGVRNVAFGQESDAVGPPEEAPAGIEAAIELLEPDKAPGIKQPFVLNFDYADPASSRRRSMC